MDKYADSFDKIRIFYNVLESSEKKYLVFLHGLGEDSLAWNSERSQLQKQGYSSIAIDLRGHGLSDRPKHEGSYQLDNFVDDVVAVLQQENIERSIIVGKCIGGMIGLKLEAEYPTTTRGLILVDTNYKPPIFAKAAADHRVLNNLISLIARSGLGSHESAHINTAKFYGTSDSSARKILSDVLHTSLKSYFANCNDILHSSLENLLVRVQVPILIVTKTGDAIFPQDIPVDLKKHIEIADNTKDLTEEIHDFLKSIEY